MENSWHDVVDAALREGITIAGGRAISGARLRQLIAQHAKTNSLDFPPPQYNNFSKFIETFPDLLLIQRREGRDFLVVPADMPELFTKEAIDSSSSVQGEIQGSAKSLSFPVKLKALVVKKL